MVFMDRASDSLAVVKTLLDDREAAMERNRVVVRVPATSANMGPGFDCLGMALSIWSEVTMERADK